MITENDLLEIIHSQRAWILNTDSGVAREELNNIAPSSSFALIVTGVRRCGKSTFLSQVIRKQKHFYYLNLEDPRLDGFSVQDFTRADDILKKEYGQRGVYFFDEIQNVEKWENFIRYLVDRKEKVVLTGSNASLMSKELGTKLTGRHLDLQMFPFSYHEFLKLSHLSASVDSFEQFSRKGGFPEFVKGGNPIILNQLLNDIVMRDVVNRFGIRNSSLLKKVGIYLISNVGKEFSFNSLTKMFQIKSVQTAVDYVSYFEDSYLLFSVPRFSYSYKKQLVNPKKVYSIDNGLSNINSVSFSKDLGRMLENIVFLHLRRKHKDIFYYKEQKECDFVIKEREKVVFAIQVCTQLNEENKEREIRGLQEAMKKLKLSQGLILTLDQENSFENIDVVPIWKWLLKKE